MPTAPEEMTLKVIAHIHTAFPTKFGIPRQSGLVDSLRGEVIFTPEYRSADAVRGLEAAVALKNGYALGIALTVGVNKKKFGENSELHYNSQAGIFFQAAKEMQKLLRLFNARENSYYIGLGDLYVTVYGGRTRLVGILLGEGYTIDEAKEKLSGVTLESLVVISRVAKAVKILIDKGILNAEDFPLLLHADEILTEKKPVDLPWEKFAFRDF